MKRTLQKGAGNMDAFLIIGFLVFIMLFTSQGDSTQREVSDGNWILGSSGTSRITSDTRTTNTGHNISISTGNAGYAYQPYEEYIVLSNNGRNPVDITGWQLRNGKDQRTYSLGGGLQRFSADIAIIPQATRLLLPQGGSAMTNVVLESGERAVITTGKIGSRHPYPIVSFKENICTGYLENLPEYSFDPPLETRCPRPAVEPGLTNLDTECRAFVERLSSCRTPEFDTKDRNGEPCSTCIRGERLSSSCASFIREHFTYQGCVAYHSTDPDFHSGRTWRLFLERGWEMWAKDYEAVELFDRFGNLVQSVNY